MLGKIFRSLLKLILPIVFKILIKCKSNRRVINFLNEKSYFSNHNHDFSPVIKNMIKNDKILALDVGAQGGFNSDFFFPKKYNVFFEDILVEPIKSEADKLTNKKYIINKGLWSKKEKRTLFILGNRPGSSSMYEPQKKYFDLHNIKEKDYENFNVTSKQEVECDTLSNLLEGLKIKNLDYLKIDTQGSELEIIKGIGDFRPLLIRIEAHIFSMYKNAPSWHEILNYLHNLNYVSIDWKAIGGHCTRIPAEMDMIFVPNFDNEIGQNLIKNSKEKFISLMLIFGQLSILKIILKRLNINYSEIKKFEDLYFN